MIFLTFPVVCNYEMEQASDRSDFLLAGRAILVFVSFLTSFGIFNWKMKENNEL